jgi:hypothetical protein
MQDALDAARKEYVELQSGQEEIISGLVKDGESMAMNAEQSAAFAGFIEKSRELRDTIRQFEEANDIHKELLTPITTSAADIAAAFEAVASGKSGGEYGGAKNFDVFRQLIESDPYRKMKDTSGVKMDSPFEWKHADLAGTVRRKDIYGSLPGGPGDLANFGGVERDPMVTRAHRRMRVRDLFPVRTTTAALIEFFKVTGLTNNASVVPERNGGAFGVKPQSGLTFTGIAANVRTIAHWEVAGRNILDDEGQLQAVLEDELLYGLQLHEDYQILSGTGTGQDLLGVLNTPGIQTYAKSAGQVTDNYADALRRAATKVVLAYYEPTGIVLHPSDWEAIQLAKNLQNSYLFPVTFDMAGTVQLWNLPVVSTPAITQGTALIGNFGNAWQLYDRQEANIRIADQHAGLFIQNALVFLAEERLALAGKRPEAMVAVNLLG